MKNAFIALILLVTYPAAALADPIKCAADDSACLINSLTSEVMQREFLEQKLQATEKEKNLAEQFAQEQERRAETAEHENSHRMSGATFFLCGLVVGIAFVGLSATLAMKAMKDIKVTLPSK